MNTANCPPVLRARPGQARQPQPLIWRHHTAWFSSPQSWPGLRNTISRGTEIIQMSRPGPSSASPSSCVIITSTSGRPDPKSHQIFPTFSQVQFDVRRGWPTDQSFCSLGRLESVKNRIGKMDLFFTFHSESFYSIYHLLELLKLSPNTSGTTGRYFSKKKRALIHIFIF